MSATTKTPAGLGVRALRREDIAAVVDIDAAYSGRTRRAYFDRRLSAALRQPELHVQLAIDEGGVLAGYALARVLEGEFGRSQPGLRLEAIGVRDPSQKRGLGRALHTALEQAARKRSIAEMRTAASWRNTAMLGFLGRLGYSLAPALVLECHVQGAPLGSGEAAGASSERDRPGDPNDYSAPAANDYERLARDRVEVRLLQAKDLEQVVRIDRNVSGSDRQLYMQHALDEALRDSAIRISLAAIKDGTVAGFVMARADLGDFGRAEPVAVLDTIDVDPGHAHGGIGRALLSQLFVNLQALRIERVETMVAADNLGLLRFFYGVGFEPAQRLALVKPLG